MEVQANVRYQGPKVTGKLTDMGDGVIRVDFNHQVRAIMAGQSSVFYDIEYPDDVIGGGHIHSVLD